MSCTLLVGLNIRSCMGTVRYFLGLSRSHGKRMKIRSAKIEEVVTLFFGLRVSTLLVIFDATRQSSWESDIFHRGSATFCIFLIICSLICKEIAFAKEKVQMTLKTEQLRRTKPRARPLPS